MNNEELRRCMKERDIRQWEIAEVIGISEFTFSRWMRKELSKDNSVKVHQAVKIILKEKGRRDVDE